MREEGVLEGIVEAFLAFERFCQEKWFGYITMGTDEHADGSTGVDDEHPGFVGHRR